MSQVLAPTTNHTGHGDVIKWEHFPRYWPFVRGIHRLPVNSPHKRQWRGAWMISLIRAWTNVWVNNRDAGDLRRHRAHYDVTIMVCDLHWRSRLPSYRGRTQGPCALGGNVGWPPPYSGASKRNQHWRPWQRWTHSPPGRHTINFNPSLDK